MSSRIASLALAATVLIAGAHARAQVTEPAPVLAVEPAALESTEAAAARTAVARAKALFAVGDYRAALADFTRAHELLHDHPRQADVLNNIAVCYERMFRYDLALTFYQRYLDESTTASADDRAEVQAVMTSLRDLLGTVRITGLPGADIWIDDRQLGQVPADLLVPAGLHVIEIRARGYESMRRELRVVARTTHALDADLEKIDTYQGLPSTYFWIGTGLTGAALITGAVFGIAALNERADTQREADRDLHVEEGPVHDLTLQADIAFGAALVLGVGTTVLYFVTDWHGGPPQDERPSQAHAWSIDVSSHAVAASYRSALP